MDVAHSPADPAERPRLPLSSDEFFACPEIPDPAAEGESITSRTLTERLEQKLNLSLKEQSEWRRLLLEAS